MLLSRFTTFQIILKYSLYSSHIAKIKIDQNRKTCLQILNMWCKNVKEKRRDSKKIFLYDVLFCKSRLSKMVSTKTNESVKRYTHIG